MPNSLQDAIAGIVYRKILARPDRFPNPLRAIVESHQRIWRITKEQPDSYENHMTFETSKMFQRLIEALQAMPERLPEFLAEDRE